MTPSPSLRRVCTILTLLLLGLTTMSVGQNVISDQGTEIVEARTENARHLLMPDGTRRAMIHAGPIHYRADGRWEPIDLTVRATGRPDKPYAVRANRFQTWFGATVAHGVQMEHGSVRITDWKDLAWVETDGSGAVVRRIPADLSGAMTHENQVIVPGIFPGVRAELTISTSGKKVDYILTDDTLVDSAPSSAVYAGISERMVLRGVQMAEMPQAAASDALTLTGSDGEPVAQLRRPVAYDASVPYHSADDPARPVIDMAYVMVPVDAHTVDLTTRLPLDWLADTTRVLPITLDPTLDFVTSGANSTGFVNDNDDCEPVGGTFTGTADPQTDIVYGWFDGFENFYYDGYGSFDISGFAPYLSCVQVNSVTYNWRVHYQFQSCGDPVILKFGRTENNNNPQVGWPGGGNNCGSRRAWIENNNQRYRGGGKNGIGLQNATGIPANFVAAAGSPAGRINMGWSYDGGDDGCTFLSGGDDSEYYCVFGHNQGTNAPFVTVDYTYNTPTLTADVQQVCSGQTSNVTFNFAGSGCTYRLYDGPRPSGSLLTATTSSTHTETITLTSDQTYYLYTEYSGEISSTFATFTLQAVNCSGTCRSVTSNVDGVALDLNKRDIRANDVSFDGLGIPANSLISDVNVTIDFETNDGNETSFEFISNNGATESTSLVDGDELGDGDPNCQFSSVNMGTRTITFDEDATTAIGNFAPASGSSVDPNCGNVDFDRWETWSTNPGTDWFIRSGSTADAFSPTLNGGFVRVNTYTVDICGCKHASFGQATANGVSPLTICPNSGPVTLTHEGSDLNMDDDGFGDELRWFSGSCGGTQIGTGTILTLNPGDAAYPGLGTTTYYCQYYVEGDPCGGTAGVNCASVSVTVEDVTPPTVTCQDIVVSLGPGGTTSIVPADVFLSGGDDCGVITLQSVTPNTFDCADLGDNTVTLTVADLSGNTATCNATVTVDQFDPTDIVTGTGTFSGSCFSVFRNDWLDILDPSGDVLISINDQNQDLGQVNVTLDNAGASQSVPADAPCAAFDFFYMGRQYTITTTRAPSGPVGVRLYFTTSELNAHITASTAASAPGCTDNDDVNSISDLFVTRYLTGASAGDPGGVLLTPVGTGVDYGGEYVEFTTTQFSEFFLHGSESGAPLPVELLRFEATAQDDAIRLDWATASELDNAGFEVQRSTDGVDFAPIGWVDGNGTTSELSTYRFDDRQVQANIRYYYRLKQVDADGAFEYSPVRSAALGVTRVDGVSIWPNPTTRRVNVRIEHAGGQAEIDLTDLNGRRIAQRTVQVDGVAIERFDLNDVAAGVYLVRVRIGDRQDVHRLVVE